MQDKMAFQPEAFPLEVLGSEEAETVFEDGELEDERYRGGRGGGSRQGFSARRRAPARRRRPLPRPSPPQRPGSLYPPPRRRWPAVPWPIGGGLTIAEPQCPEPPPCVCPPATDAAAAEPDTSAPRGFGRDGRQRGG